MELKPVRLAEVAEGLAETWSPRVVAQVNDHLLKVARLEGEFVWHAHEGEDELFLVLKGRLRIQVEEGGEVTLGPGEAFVVPAGTRHNPIADGECWIALLEPASTRHTGDVVTERTRSLDEQMG